MPTTSNFGWTTPADTDLVKDGAAAIRTLGNGIDTSFVDLKGGTTGQVLAKASNSDLDFTWATDASGIPATIFDAKGDLIAASAADTAARLAVGANGTVLTADSTTATGLKWGTLATSANWSLLNSGGTTLTGAQTITISGITDANSIMILYRNASSASADSGISVRINGNTGSVYTVLGSRIESTASYNANFVGDENALSDSKISISQMSNNAGSTCSGFCLISGGNTTGVKIYNAAGGVERAGGNNQVARSIGGVINDSNLITSVSLFSTVGNFDGGTVYVYKTS